MHRDSPTNSVFLKRRAILFLGVSVVPFLQLKATKALEGQLFFLGIFLILSQTQWLEFTAKLNYYYLFV